MYKISSSSILRIVPLYVRKVADILINNGYEAYLVGGAVRDIVLEREPKDFDIATNAKPEQMTKIFKKTIDTASKFGTIIVVVEDKNGEPFNVEVTTYRIESDYFSGRWPSSVKFTASIKEDLSRRDFTMNALALDMNRLRNKENTFKDLIVDYFGGLDDLNSGIIRAIGNPIERFKEDGLRPIRACRFASELGFKIERNTFKSISEILDIVSQISIERFRDEFLKILYNSPKPSVGIDLLYKSGILKIFIPELMECVGITQPEFHKYDVYRHLLNTVDIAQDNIKLAALFHDIGKARTMRNINGKQVFYQHDIVGAKITENILKRLRLPNSVIKKTVLLVRHHMFYYPSADWRKVKTSGEKLTRSHLKKLSKEKKNIGGWSDSAIRRFIAKVGGIDNINDLIALRIADANSNPKSKFSDVEIEALQTRIAEVIKKDSAFKVSDLNISGDDLKELGIKPGPRMGKILNSLLDEVLDKPELNTKGKLMKLVKNKYI